MIIYVICIIVLAGIWIINGIWIIQGAKAKMPSEVYMHSGLGLFFSLFILEVTLGNKGVWAHLNIRWIQALGYILFIPSVFFVVSSHISLKQKGKPKSADCTATTVFIDTGIYGIIRQPMTLGMAIWSVALILVSQSVLSIILGIVLFFCFLMSARKEAEFNIKKFGGVYREYMERVPMWNIFKGLKSK